MLNFLAVLAICAAAVHAGNQDSSLFAALQAALLPGLVISADAAVLLLAAGTGVNVALLLLLSVVILAQEMWSVVCCWLAVALNLAALVWLGFAPSLLAVAPLLAAGLLTLGDLRAYRVNPVMLKELRGRMRGARGFAIITIFLTLMGFFTLLLYLLQDPPRRRGRDRRAGARAVYRRALH